MDLSFLFLDDCESPRLDAAGTTICSLTGLLVPAESYGALRSRFYEILKWSIVPAPNTINIHPPELHGSEFLRDECDERKLDVLDQLVTLVLEGDLRIYRIAYYVTRKMRDLFAGDPKMLGLCWFSMLAMMRPALAGRAIVPVMDMTKDCRSIFSSQVRSMDIMRAAGFGHMCSIEHAENLLGEVFYVDSRFAVFIQVVDVVAYLRHKKDMSQLGRTQEMTEFQRRLLGLSDRLKPAIAREETIEGALDGEV